MEVSGGDAFKTIFRLPQSDGLQQGTFFAVLHSDDEAEAPLWMGRLPVLQRWCANV